MSMPDLVKEAYIDPIRSVMVVDDEYPTLTKFITGQDTSEQVDRDRLLDVTEVCRHHENNWMLDVHDGQFTGEGEVDNLYHSDLLILDYHLEGKGDDGRGEKALKVLSCLAQKDHFNLVVVHTKGYTDLGTDEGYRAVFKDIVFNLQIHKPLREVPPKFLAGVQDAINSWNDDSPNIITELVASISDLDFMKLTDAITNPLVIDDTSIELQELKARFDARPTEDSDLAKLEFCWLKWFVLVEKSKLLAGLFGEIVFDDLQWSSNDTYLWVKTRNLFVVVIGKDVPSKELPDKLLYALVDWKPHPHRMLLAKLRHKIDEHGFSLASDIVSKQHVQAGWLRQLLQCKEDELENQSWITINNHLEELSYSFKKELCDYLSSIVVELLKTGSPTDIESQFIIPEILSDELNVFKEINTFNNSIAVDGWHLTTGHILRDISGNFHMVVSPACDLVPGRSKHGKLTVELQLLYPISSSLKKDSDTKKLNSDDLFERCKAVVTSKKLLFLPIDGEIVILSSTVNALSAANPNVKSLVVGNDGKWGPDRNVIIYEMNLKMTPPYVHSCEYIVVAQLRYEYALHHSKISGEHSSRIGLGYQ
jgi:hypothetical protein